MATNVNKKAVFCTTRVQLAQIISVLVGLQATLGSDCPSEAVSALSAVMDLDYALFKDLSK